MRERGDLTLSIELPCSWEGCTASLYRQYWTSLGPRGLRRGVRVEGWSIQGSDERGWTGRCPDHRGKRAR